jgi:hypothetical protein
VVDALQRIHAALVSGGLVVDTQPISPRPWVKNSSGRLGTLDMREWLDTIEAVDALVAETVRGGLYSIDRERRLIVTDSWDSGSECVATVTGWQGTRVSSDLAHRIAASPAPVTVEQEVRLRVLRAT